MNRHDLKRPVGWILLAADHDPQQTLPAVETQLLSVSHDVPVEGTLLRRVCYATQRSVHLRALGRCGTETPECSVLEMIGLGLEGVEHYIVDEAVAQHLMTLVAPTSFGEFSNLAKTLKEFQLLI